MWELTGDPPTLAVGKWGRPHAPKTSLQNERLAANEWPDYRYEHKEFNQCASFVS